MSDKSILLYTYATPNNYTITMCLEELRASYSGGVVYETQTLDLRAGVQKEEWFIKINPNGRIPTIVDRGRNNFTISETSAILLYLVQHYDPEYKFWFNPTADADNYSEMIQWLCFAHGGLGPMQGQAHHFLKFAPEDIPYGKKRYVDEAKRLYGVLEIRLKDRDWLAGSGRGKYSLADMKTFPWTRLTPVVNIDLNEFPNVKAWAGRVAARENTQVALTIPKM